jgi:formylglycine-generating enzyme required for sulfatase activity
LKPKDVFSECAGCPEMVVVQAGSFMMGSPNEERDRKPGEEQLSITFPRRFAVGKYAVTFDEWDACVVGSGCDYRPADLGWGRGNRPVINVSWNDAKRYVAWLGAKTRKNYRLLSESEREYVTRAGAVTPFWWGSSISPQQANYDDARAYGRGSRSEGRRKTVPVDSFGPNPWGLYNVHGNVWEWTEDCWNERNIGNPGDSSARTSGNCERRVVRGGSWDLYPRYLRAAFRIGFAGVDRSNSIGFRVARSIAP